MKHRNIMALFSSTVVLMTLLTGTAGATDYIIDSAAAPEYYRATDYVDTYGAEYNYGGRNITDDVSTALPYGISSLTQIGAMEKTKAPGTPGVSIGGALAEFFSESSSWISPVMEHIKFINAATLRRTDGSIGTLKISLLGINMKVYEGATAESMKKGVGHFTSTSGWDGNVGICGHNRGAPYIIGGIKNLKAGDTIQYSTTLGTRSYSVVLVEKIKSTDWSYLSASTDNRITLITCVANEPAFRWCVQAIEQH